MRLNTLRHASETAHKKPPSGAALICSQLAQTVAVAQGLGVNELSQMQQQAIAYLLQAGYSSDQIVSGVQQLMALIQQNQNQHSKLGNAIESGKRVFIGGQIIGTAGGVVMGLLVAGGFTVATDSYPFAGQTLPSGAISGGIVGFVEALPFSLAAGGLDFAWNYYWGK